MKRRAAVLLRPADLDFSQNSRFISPSPTEGFELLGEDLQHTQTFECCVVEEKKSGLKTKNVAL